MTMEHRRDELIELLADAFALGRLSTAAYERFAAAVARAADDRQLIRLAQIVRGRLYMHSTPERPAVAPTELRDDGDPTSTITPATLTADFYRALSWQAGHAPSRASLEQLVDPQVQFINSGRVMGLRAFWTGRVELWVKHSIAPFFQRELAERTTLYGDIAHRLSVYEAVLASGKLAGRGVNSLQFCRSDRWRIVSVAWDEADDEIPLPLL
jgi:hypothetical protein